MWILTIRSPNSVPRDHLLQPGKNTLGRKSDNDIILKDELASRLHAQIDCQGDRVMITDLGSTNGTFVNQKRLSEPHRISPGDQIRIGYHLASVTRKETEVTVEDDLSTTSTQPLTPDFMLESFEQNAVFIYDVANRLTTVLDLDQVLQEIADFLRTAIGAQECRIVMAPQFDQIRKPGFFESMAQQAIEQRSVVIYPNVTLSGSTKPSKQNRKIRAAVCVPVVSEDQTVALVFTYKTNPDSRPFDQNDIQLAVAVSHQAALAIQRDQILKKAQVLEKWALTDPLTGADNRRHILQKAEVEFVRANRFQHPLTAIIMDIDNFKLVNDTYGHFVGDHLMRVIAERCKKYLRSVDLFGRYGGDEFLIMMVETSLEDAITAAKRLRQCISENPVVAEGVQVNATVSMGIAPFSKDCSDAVSLIRRADDALLYAKNISKNNIGVYQSPGSIRDIPDRL
jgi:diguanylate cyclase (GGDEF)-like protein